MRRMMLNSTSGQPIKVNLIPRDATVLISGKALDDLNEMSGVMAVPSSEDPKAVSDAMKAIRAKIDNGELKISFP